MDIVVNSLLMPLDISSSILNHFPCLISPFSFVQEFYQSIHLPIFNTLQQLLPFFSIFFSHLYFIQSFFFSLFIQFRFFLFLKGEFLHEALDPLFILLFVLFKFILNFHPLLLLRFLLNLKLFLFLFFLSDSSFFGFVYFLFHFSPNFISISIFCSANFDLLHLLVFNLFLPILLFLLQLFLKLLLPVNFLIQ